MLKQRHRSNHMAKPKKTEQATTSDSYIKPAVAIEGHKNAFIKHVETDEPELMAVGMARIPGTNEYAAYTIKIVGDKVVKMTVDEPNLKRISEETAKIAFIDTFINSEEF